MTVTDPPLYGRLAGGIAGGAAGLWAIGGAHARQLWRYGIVALAAVLTAAWTGLLLALPEPARPPVAAAVLVLDTAVLGTTLIGGLVLLDRGHGMLAALLTSPAGRLISYLVARVGLLTGVSIGSAVPIALAGRLGLPAALVGVGLTAVLSMLLAVALAARCRSVLSFVVALPLGLLPLVVPALAQLAGVRHPAWFAAPTTGAMALVRDGFGTVTAAVASISWLGLAAGAAALLAVGQLRRYAVSGPPSRAVRQPLRPGVPRFASRSPVGALLRADSATIRRDPLLLLIAASPLLLGLALRAGYPLARDWLAGGFGFDLDPYRPVLLAVAVVLHVPVMFGMVGALLVLDDVDDRALPALRTSPLTLPRYLGYRAGLVTVAGLVGLAVTAPLSGLAGGGGLRWPAVALAALLAPLMMLATLSVASNKVAGVAALKLLGLPLYAPLASWWLTGPAGLALAPLPAWWVLQALWRGGLYPVAGGLVLAAMLGLLARRALTRLAQAPAG